MMCYPLCWVKQFIIVTLFLGSSSWYTFLGSSSIFYLLSLTQSCLVALLPLCLEGGWGPMAASSVATSAALLFATWTFPFLGLAMSCMKSSSGFLEILGRLGILCLVIVLHSLLHWCFFCLDWRRHQNSDCQQSEIVTDFQNCRLMCTGKLDLPLPEPEETGTNLQSIWRCLQSLLWIKIIVFCTIFGRKFW